MPQVQLRQLSESRKALAARHRVCKPQGVQVGELAEAGRQRCVAAVLQHQFPATRVAGI